MVTMQNIFSLNCSKKMHSGEESILFGITTIFKQFYVCICRFVASDIYFGLENLLNLDKIRNNAVNLSTSIHTFRNDIKSLSSHRGLFNAIEKLDDGYNEMKELINQNSSGNEVRCVVPVSKGFQDLKKAFSRLQALVDESYVSLIGKRKKKRDKSSKKKGKVVKTKVVTNKRIIFHK